ncbi:hypothetical protein GUITHDRAFT_106795 [Guillardia theta CCMP2712]|uniref:AB hydrolase-1 domain-containing protein n=1 Tax=Guillardia theta (strain CCMP2712) TaxID=905079 RepID=L1JFR0_GUITC|nr:hypothetical protein GUITHDRAFT_106795 [Guillardia theta CCMP2712]EKX47348.1 hypothetical protein GUITHDRAFT_106795 [Guillardia theta CCMP2712]|eukprot:XP_005834328.1 hypothetical protein GUITHDRAFT_106795 [Guillardia theta CCMP2712]
MVWETLVNLVCRPPRYSYDPDEVLGPKRFRIDGRLFERVDVEVMNKRRQRLKCSHYMPVLEGTRAGHTTKFPCVIYCHGNCGSRVDASDCLDLLLPQMISVFAFDFSGSGLSDGETISLGYYEQDDLLAVIEYLRESGLVSRIGLWGRSMGAATSVLVAARDPSIAGMVLDSAFSSLTQVMYELANQYMKQVKVPKILINGAISVLRKSVQKKGNFDIRHPNLLKDVNPEDAADKCFIPALFAHADGDDFVLAHHSKQLYERYAGDKNIITFGGDHNSPRPAFFFDSVGIFFYNVLIENAEYEDIEPGSSAVEGRSMMDYGASSASQAPEYQRMRQSPSKESLANTWGDSHALEAVFSPFDEKKQGEDGVMEALKSSLREMEAELGSNDPNVTELKKMLREYESR